LVMPSEIKLLDKLHAYMQLPGNLPVVPLKFSFTHLEAQAIDYDLKEDVFVKSVSDLATEAGNSLESQNMPSEQAGEPSTALTIQHPRLPGYTKKFWLPI